MLVENRFPVDTRVRNEAFTLVSNGLKVSVVALRGPSEGSRENVNGVSVYRLPRLTLFRKLPHREGSRAARLLNKARILAGYITEYVYFTLGCFVVTTYIAAREGIDVIHAHNPPDTLFLVGAFHKLFGTKFIFDHHDLCPELYRSRYATPSGLVTRALAFCERASVRLADAAIATNESYRAIDIERNGAAAGRVFVVRNGPDLSRVRLSEPDAALRGRAKVILGYLGAMNPQDGVDYLLRALSHLRHTLKRSDFHCVLIGEGDSLDELKSLAGRLQLDECITFTGFIPDADMIRFLSAVDICLDPNPSSPLNDVSTWIKVMEYMALGKPVVSFDLKETRVSAGEAAAYVLPNDELAFARVTAELMDDPGRRARMADVGRRRVESELGWHVTSLNLIRVYQALLRRPIVNEGRPAPV